MVKKSEYELMPVQPIKDLKKEILKLKNELKKDDGTAKILTKVLNSNVEIQKSVKKVLTEHQKVTDKLNDVVDFLSDVSGAEETEETDIEKVTKRIAEMEKQNSEMLNIITTLNEEIRRHSFFRTRLPKGMLFAYQRTK